MYDVPIEQTVEMKRHISNPLMDINAVLTAKLKDIVAGGFGTSRLTDLDVRRLCNVRKKKSIVFFLSFIQRHSFFVAHWHSSLCQSVDWRGMDYDACGHSGLCHGEALALAILHLVSTQYSMWYLSTSPMSLHSHRNPQEKNIRVTAFGQGSWKVCWFKYFSWYSYFFSWFHHWFQHESCQWTAYDGDWQTDHVLGDGEEHIKQLLLEGQVIIIIDSSTLKFRLLMYLAMTWFKSCTEQQHLVNREAHHFFFSRRKSIMKQFQPQVLQLFQEHLGVQFCKSCWVR